MSDRGKALDLGPNAGVYKSAPTPSESEDMPTYINDELLRLGGIVNSILEGGALPPQTKMPIRTKEGMMVYFSEALNEDIWSAGVYLYREGRWWKIIDDPSQIEGVEQIFKKTTGDIRPETPPPSKDAPAGWSKEPPQKADKSEWIWVCVSTLFDSQTQEYTWADPVAWSAGVIDGVDGEDGAVGPPGVEGDLFEWWFKESSTQLFPPTQYPPTPEGWQATIPDEPTTSVWQTFTRVSADGSWTPFSFPIKISGEDGEEGPQGIPGTDGGVFETWYSEFPSRPETPTGYPPQSTDGSVWSLQPPENATDPIWATTALVNADGTLEGIWTFPVRWSGEEGPQGIPGTDGGVFETWYAETNSRPETPTGYPPTGVGGVWSQQPPINYSETVWATTALVEGGDTVNGLWTFPVQWSADEGPEGRRGFVSLSTDSVVWDDQIAWDLVVNNTTGLNPNYPIEWDSVTMYNDAAGFSETRRYVSGAEPGYWEPVAAYIDGNLIVTGTVASDQIAANAITTEKIEASAVNADKIAANSITTPKIVADAISSDKIQAAAITTEKIGAGQVSADQIAANAITTQKIFAGAVNADKIAANSIAAYHIVANSITGNEINAGSRIVIGGNQAGNQDVVVIDGIDSESRIWVGNLDSGLADFRVDTEGNMYANNAYLDNAIVRGTVIADSGQFTGSVYATDGVFSGSVYATDGVFNGTIYATDGVFDGEIFANNLTGEQVSGLSDNIGSGGIYVSSASPGPKKIVEFNIAAQPFERTVVIPAPYFSTPSTTTGSTIDLIVYKNGLETGRNSFSGRNYTGAEVFTGRPVTRTLNANESATFKVSMEHNLGDTAAVSNQAYTVSVYKNSDFITFI